MADSWEDLDNEDFIIPIQPITQNIRQLEERKLIEESDNDLTNELFENNQRTNLINNNLVNNKQELPKREKIKKISNQNINEVKQKERSIFIKKQKENIIRIKELYGENDYENEYANYEDKIYNN